MLKQRIKLYWNLWVFESPDKLLWVYIFAKGLQKFQKKDLKNMFLGILGLGVLILNLELVFWFEAIVQIYLEECSKTKQKMPLSVFMQIGMYVT